MNKADTIPALREPMLCSSPRCVPPTCQDAIRQKNNVRIIVEENKIRKKAKEVKLYDLGKGDSKIRVKNVPLKLRQQ